MEVGVVAAADALVTEGVGEDGAVLSGDAVELFDAPAEGVREAEGAASAGLPDAPAEAVTPSVSSVGATDSPVVRSCPPRPPPDDDPEDDPEKENPAITAATDTTPTAPATTAARRFRAVPCFRRARRPGPEGVPGATGPPGPPGSPATTAGSSRVSSYASVHPCAAAGSTYSSYAGVAAACGWYTFGCAGDPAPGWAPGASIGPLAAFAPYAPLWR
ncbi:hypothetical protein [Streptomyces sp. NPDC002088]|uniref:hypothetical protein n=1 Tax=Streptomyces sp. NPDC002088 TaxID=3154665 RepID=UPI0033165CAB